MEQLTLISDTEREVSLARMQRLATGLLVVVTAVYGISAAFITLHPAVAFVAATAEAAMIGAIADWFAVSALFRRPLGLPIPHTAIIPRKKASIAAQFGDFVTRNFLSESVVASRLAAMDLSAILARWLQDKTNSERVASQLTAGIAGLVKVIDDDRVQALIEQRLGARIRETRLAPVLGDIMGYVLTGERRQDLLSAIVHSGVFLLEDHRWLIREKIIQQTPWWFHDAIDREIYERLMNTVYDTLMAIDADPDHPLRKTYEEMIDGFLKRLKDGEDLAEKEDALKEELLGEPALRDFTRSLWQDIKRSLMAQGTGAEKLEPPVAEAVREFGRTIEADKAIADRIDEWAVNGACYLVRTYGHEVNGIITETINGWDAEATARRVELQMGPDLQFIRINGTVVGGLVGLLIHTVTWLAQAA